MCESNTWKCKGSKIAEMRIGMLNSEEMQLALTKWWRRSPGGIPLEPRTLSDLDWPNITKMIRRTPPSQWPRNPINIAWCVDRLREAGIPPTKRTLQDNQ